MSPSSTSRTVSPSPNGSGSGGGAAGIRRRKGGKSPHSSGRKGAGSERAEFVNGRQRSCSTLHYTGMFLFGMTVGLLTGATVVLYAHARQTQVSVSQAARVLFTANCQLGQICDKDALRPKLEDGRESHAVWDVPRHHMKSKFKELQKVFPGIQVTYLWADPVVVYFDNALSDNDIQLMLNIATPRFSPSTIVQPDGSSKPDTGRTSDTAWLHFDHYDTQVRPIVNRLVSLAGFQVKNAESLGVNRYRQGQYFNMHYDFMNEAGVREDPMFPQGCQRAATVLAYLSDVESGGETVFVRDENYDPESNINENNPDHLVVRPKKGRVLVWFDMHPYRELIDERTLHGGQPVIKGEKIAATIFIRNCTRAY